MKLKTRISRVTKLTGLCVLSLWVSQASMARDLEAGANGGNIGPSGADARPKLHADKLDNPEGLFVRGVKVTEQVQVLKQGKLTVTQNEAGDPGSIAVADKKAVLLSGADAEITMSGGTITTTGGSAEGISSTGTGAQITMSGGTITTTGAFAYGISSTGDGATITMSGGAITTSGVLAIGIYSTGNDAEITMSGGAITTSRAGVDGIYSIGTNAKITMSDGAITTSGLGADGITSTGTGAQITMSGGTITTSGDSADGIESRGADAKITMSGGAITTEGKKANGITSTGDGATITMSGGTITTSGEKEDGIYSRGADGISSRGHNAEITMSGGTITTSGDHAEGIYSQGRNAQITMSGGAITTEGAGAEGIFSGGTGAKITMSGGAITTEGAGAAGIFSLADAQVTMSGGTITTSGADAYGISTLGLADGQITMSDGAITTSGANADGISSRGTNARITMSGGTITTSGANADGIFSGGSTNLEGADAQITLSGGAITTEGAGADGIYSGAINAQITISGVAITTSGADAEGIYSGGTNAQITMSGGTITTSGEGAYGISTSVAGAVADGLHKLTMTGGMIRTTGDESHGILIKDNGAAADALIELALGGDIHVSGKDSAGVFIVDRVGGVSQMEITGRITATGAATNAIEVAEHADALALPLILSGDAVISGDIISRGGADDFLFKDNARVEGDVNLGGGDDSLTLSDNAMMAGTADGGAGDDTFDGTRWAPQASRSRIATALTLKNFEDVSLDVKKMKEAPFPFIKGEVKVNGETEILIATLDLSGQSAQSAYVGVVPGAINQVINQRFSGGANSMASRQHASARPVMVAATELLPGSLFRGHSPLIWGDFFGSGRERDEDGQVQGYTQRSLGAVFGGEQQYGGEGEYYLGGLFGYARSDFSTDGVSVKTDTDTFFGGVYGRAEAFGWLTLGASLIGGVEDHDNKRFVQGSTLMTAKGDYNSYFLSPSLELSTALPMSSVFEWRPSVALNYTIAWYDSYTENGAGAFSLALEDRKASNLQTRVQLAGAFLLEEGTEFSLRGGLKSRFGDGDDVKGRLFDEPFTFGTAGRDNVHSAFVGASLRYRVLDGLAVQADIDYTNAVFGRVNEEELSGQMLVEYRF